MKIYNVYYTNSKNSSWIAPHLYAFTTKRKLRDIFMEQRNTELFTCVEHSIDKDKYARICNTYSDKRLSVKEFYTKEENIAGYCTVGTIKIVSTGFEELQTILHGDKILQDKCSFMYSIPEFCKSLCEDMTAAGMIYHGAINKKLRVDDFEVFMRLYGGTFNTEFTKKKTKSL